MKRSSTASTAGAAPRREPTGTAPGTGREAAAASTSSLSFPRSAKSISSSSSFSFSISDSRGKEGMLAPLKTRATRSAVGTWLCSLSPVECFNNQIIIIITGVRAKILTDILHDRL
jgi:hypothetical protein